MRSLFQKCGVMFIPFFLKKPGWSAAENRRRDGQAP
jgi:hypothetical protein